MRCVLSLTAASGRPTSTVLGSARRNIDLDLDRQGVDADEREGVELGEHAGDRGKLTAFNDEARPIVAAAVERFKLDSHILENRLS